MESYQLYTDLLKRIANDYPDHFQDKDKLLALFIDLSPKSKTEIKALRGFVVNDCNEAIENLKGKNTVFSTDELISQINIICGNPEIDQEAASALCQSYADIIGVKYDRKRVQQEFGSSNASNRNIIGASTNPIVSPQSPPAPGNTKFTVSTGNVSSAQTPPPPPPSKSNKTIIVVCILVVLIISGVLFYLKPMQNKQDSAPENQITQTSTTELSEMTFQKSDLNSYSRIADYYASRYALCEDAGTLVFNSVNLDSDDSDYVFLKLEKEFDGSIMFYGKITGGKWIIEGYDASVFDPANSDAEDISKFFAASLYAFAGVDDYREAYRVIKDYLSDWDLESEQYLETIDISGKQFSLMHTFAEGSMYLSISEI